MDAYMYGIICIVYIYYGMVLWCICIICTVYIYYMYICMVFTTERFLEVAIESWYYIYIYIMYMMYVYINESLIVDTYKHINKSLWLLIETYIGRRMT